MGVWGCCCVSAVISHTWLVFILVMPFLPEDVLLAVASAAIAELSRGNSKMQNAFAKAQVIHPLVELLRGRKISVQVKGAMAIEALCERNTYIQMRFLAKSVTKFLLKLLKASSSHPICPVDWFRHFWNNWVGCSLGFS